MSLRQRIAGSGVVLATIAGLVVAGSAAPALASLPRFPVYFQFFSGPTAAADCAAAGAAGVNSDSWDTYRCVPGSPPFTGQIELLAYVVE